MKKIIFTAMILSSFLLTACGDSKDKSSSLTAEYNTNRLLAEVADSENYDNNGSVQDNSDSDEENKSDLSSVKENNSFENIIQKEMLVYSCNITVDVLDFADYIILLKNNIDTYSAFVENENYSDGGSNGRWYYADSDKWKSYSAVIRIPSEDYEAFCDDITKQGELRSKNASVENMSNEYYDLSADLEIYEAKEARYMERLSTITDEEYAISIEKELTDIQIEISRIKTRMNDIRTDVAYSYVYLTVNEVKEYMEEPVKTDTFLQRLGNTFSEASTGFLNFMEKLLFILIYILPYVILTVLLIFIIKKICKFIKKHRLAKFSVKSQPVTSDIKSEGNNTPKE
ncbi:MAG: DUF4349 domain-containing protein [Ruminococcus sp.]|nr:DUF4349 domain-containing protein [Ruminococcus sp.]